MKCIIPEMKKQFLLLFLILFFTFSGINSYADSQIMEGLPSSGLEYEELPVFLEDDIIILNGNIPSFKRSQLTTEAFIFFSPLDPLGRTGLGFACLGPETLPKVQRGQTGNIRPSGWHTIRYDDLITDRYLYNRSHILGFLLTGDVSTPENLFTGTRHLNAESMTAYEIPVAQYIEQSGNHVLYRVSPIYRDDDLVVTGVQMEAYSVEDLGKGICFNVFAFNVQPGILIDYRTGDSIRDPDYVSAGTAETEKSIFFPAPSDDHTATQTGKAEEPTYIINRNTRRFHKPSCASVSDIRPKNRQDFYGTREELIKSGYSPCKSCNP